MSRVFNFLKKSWLSIALVLFGSILVILFNFYTIKVLSSIRSYVNAESNFSKGQKDAVKYLIKYIDNHSQDDWNLYMQNIEIPFAANNFRKALQNNGTKEEMYNALAQGRNQPEDFDNYIWLYNNFHEYDFMKKALDIWTQCDALVLEIELLATTANTAITNNLMHEFNADVVTEQLSNLNRELSKLEFEFSDTLADISRSVERSLIIANIIFVSLIVFGGGLYFIIMLNKLKASKLRYENNFKDLETANNELDKFVYSVSHDLRAPIASIMGLIEVLKLEGETSNLPEYLNMMEESLQRQDSYIKKIISITKNKRLESQVVKVDFNNMVTGLLTDLQFNNKAKPITFKKNVQYDGFYVDETRLRIILNNLVSNAIEYCDVEKQTPYIKISSYLENNNVCIEVKDNGVGIKEEDQKKVFNMFYSGTNSKNGSGLGLYIVKDTIARMQGASIFIESKYQEGTSFKITIPYN
jgi:signal transduction histidine kinase